MKILGFMTAFILAFAGSAGVALADHWDDRGYWRDGYYGGTIYYEAEPYHGDAYEQEYRSGDCEVERKWDGDDYKEVIRCDNGASPPAYVAPPGYYSPPAYYSPPGY